MVPSLRGKVSFLDILQSEDLVSLVGAVDRPVEDQLDRRAARTVVGRGDPKARRLIVALVFVAHTVERRRGIVEM